MGSLVAPLTDTLLKSVVYHTHLEKDKGLSRIDHVFHSRSTTGIAYSEVGTCNDTILVEHFDHRPVWIDIRLHQGIRATGRGERVKRPPPITIQPTDNKEQVDQFNLLLQEFCKAHPIPKDNIAEIPCLLAAAHLATVQAIQSVTGTSKNKIHQKCLKVHGRH